MNPWDNDPIVGKAAAPWESDPIVGEKPKTSVMQDIAKGAVNLGAGLVRGAGSIGSTILAPIDIVSDAFAGKGLSLESNRRRRADIDDGLTSLVGSDPESLLYKGGKLGGEIAGTAGAGGVVANTVARVAPTAAAAAPGLINAIRTSGMTAGGAKGVASIVPRAIGGAITGGASAALVNPEDAASGAAIGGITPVALKTVGALGNVIGTGVRKVASSGVNDDVAKLATRAKELGINIPADRIADSRPMNAIAAGLNYVPFSGRAGSEELMNSQLNRAVSKTFGQDSPNVTKALRTANDVLGAQFDHTLKNNGVKFDQGLLDDVTRVYNTAEKELGSDNLKAISSQVDELVKKGESGIIDGQAAYNIKRTLDRIGRQNTPAAYHALELKQALLGALDRSLGPDNAAAFAKTRQQYGNMLALEKLASNGVEGEISAARLANMKNINNEPLQELADIAAQFVKPREGQHGAAQRAAAGAVTLGLGGIPALVTGAVGGRATNAALNSGRLKALMTGEKIEPNRLSRLLGNDQAQQLILRGAPVAASQ